MAIRGRHPKPPGQAVNRNPRTHDVIEVEDIPNTSGPNLPARRANGDRWPKYVRECWAAWKAMPHARLWQASDWSFAIETAELLARVDDDAPVAVWAELRARERVMGTTYEARLGMRLRYVSPTTDGEAAAITSLDSYREL